MKRIYAITTTNLGVIVEAENLREAKRMVKKVHPNERVTHTKHVVNPSNL